MGDLEKLKKSSMRRWKTTGAMLGMQMALLLPMVLLMPLPLPHPLYRSQQLETMIST